MNLLFTILCLFFIGSVSGWLLEVIYRRFISKNNTERKWIFPGFCKGPYLPLYGLGLGLLYLFASMEQLHIIKNIYLNKAVFILVMALAMTVIEYVVGIICVKVFKEPLWDYSKEWKNYKGIICPKFSLFWAIFAVLIFLSYNHISSILQWLFKSQAFHIAMCVFYTIFILDLICSLCIKIRSKNEKESSRNAVKL